MVLQNPSLSASPIRKALSSEIGYPCAKERLTGELSQPRWLGASSDYLLNTGVSVSKLQVCWPLSCLVENEIVLYLSVRVGMLYM